MPRRDDRSWGLRQRVEHWAERFPNAAVNADEQRRLRTSLYNPLLRVEGRERGRIVDQALAILLSGDVDAEA